jgi:hypothetical protein
MTADACPHTTRELEMLRKRTAGPSPILFVLAAAWALLNLACFDPVNDPPLVPANDPTQEPKPIVQTKPNMKPNVSDERMLAFALGFVILL